MTVRGIMFVILAAFAVGCSSGSSATVTAPSSGSPGGPSVSIVSGASVLSTTAYSPNPLTVSRGSTVTFVNNDSAAHTATSATFDTKVIAPGARVSVTLQDTGSITYRCTIHPGMTGTITVQ